MVKQFSNEDIPNLMQKVFRLSRTEKIPLAEARERVAKSEGFTSWDELAKHYNPCLRREMQQETKVFADEVSALTNDWRKEINAVRGRNGRANTRESTTPDSQLLENARAQ